MGIIDRRTVSVLTTIVLFLGVGAFVYGARNTLIAFLFAIFFAYLLDPAVSPRKEGSRKARADVLSSSSISPWSDCLFYGDSWWVRA